MSKPPLLLRVPLGWLRNGERAAVAFAVLVNVRSAVTETGWWWLMVAGLVLGQFAIERTVRQTEAAHAELEHLKSYVASRPRSRVRWGAMEPLTEAELGEVFRWISTHAPEQRDDAPPVVRDFLNRGDELARREGVEKWL